MPDASNPFSPPAADLSDSAGPPAPFFAVRPAKFVALAATTFGIYGVMWSYYSWRSIRARTGERLSPFLRAFFCPITNFSLFSRLDAEASRAGVSGFVPAGWALAYLLSNFLAFLPEPWGALIALAAFLTFVPANATALRLNRALCPNASDPAPWTAGNVVATVGFGIVFVATVVGLALGEVGP